MIRTKRKAEAFRATTHKATMPCGTCGGPSNVSPEQWFSRNRDKVTAICAGCRALKALEAEEAKKDGLRAP